MRALVALLLVCALATPALAGPVASLLEDADRLYADLDYRGAAERAERAGKDESATQPQRLRAWERAGLSWLVLGQRALAKESFDRVFALDDTYKVDDPSLSAKQLQFIEEERQLAIAQRPAPVVEPMEGPVVAPVVTPAPRKTPVYKRWYVWTPVAIVIVGVALGVGLGLGLADHAPQGSLGTVGLSFRF